MGMYGRRRIELDAEGNKKKKRRLEEVPRIVKEDNCFEIYFFISCNVPQCSFFGLE